MSSSELEQATIAFVAARVALESARTTFDSWLSIAEKEMAHGQMLFPQYRAGYDLYRTRLDLAKMAYDEAWARALVENDARAQRRAEMLQFGFFAMAGVTVLLTAVIAATTTIQIGLALLPAITKLLGG